MTIEGQTILVFGKNGQVGGEIAHLVSTSETQYFKTPHQWVYASRENVDLTDAEALSTYLESQKPCAIINAAAYTAVDKAESDQDTAKAVNATAPKIMAQYSAAQSIPFVHISTDYVFDGSKDGRYTEDDPINPLGVYGATKADGEKEVIATQAPAVILRTSWVYAENGANFVHTMLRLGQERDELNIVNDQIGAPTNARDIADTVLKITATLLDNPNDTSKFGIYHMVAGGETSWHGFAEFIFETAAEHSLKTPSTLGAIPSSAYPTPAKRPLNSRLDCTKLAQNFGITLPHWKDSARICLKNILKNISHGKAKAS